MTTLANCATLQATGSSVCSCLQAVEADPPANTVQRQRWKNCTNDTTILEYEPFSPSASEQLRLTQNAYDVVAIDGTRTRYHTNGTVLALRFDLTIDSVLVPSPYLYSTWTEYTSTTNGWAALFSFFTGSEAAADFAKVRVYANGTRWWYYPTLSNSATPAQKALYIDQLETNGTVNTVRRIYYFNGTVSLETWVWASGSYTKTVNSFYVPPSSIYVPFEDRTNSFSGDAEAAALPAGWIKRIFNLGATNSSIFFYPPDPAVTMAN